MAHYLITGASSGIGAALASSLAQLGHEVSGVARRQDRLRDLAAKYRHFHPYSADVTDAARITSVVVTATAHAGPIDVAILNAGIYQPQDSSQMDPAVYAQHMDVNYMGVVNALAPVIRSMVAREAGHIAIISSVAGWRGLPKSAAYGPTKAALISLAESLYFDLTPKGIKIQVICPGFVESEATAVNDFDMPHLISAGRAATYILDGLNSSDFSVEFPKAFTRRIGLLRWLPDRLYFRLVGRQTGAL